MTKRDPAFLHIAIVAAIGGFAAIGVAIGFPVYAWSQHRPATPTFFFFALWGIAALCGAAASVHTYFVTTPPQKPPRGGIPIRLLRPVDALPAPDAQPSSQRRAA